MDSLLPPPGNVAVGTIAQSGGAVQKGKAGATSVGLQIQGTWSGTLAFQFSLDGQNWVALATANVLVPYPAGGPGVPSTTANGLWTAPFPAGMVFFQVVASSWTSGTANIVLSLH